MPQSKGTEAKALEGRLTGDRGVVNSVSNAFELNQKVILTLPVLRMATEPGGPRLAALLNRGDLLQLNAPYRYGNGEVFYATVLRARDPKWVGRIGIVRTDWVEPAHLEIPPGPPAAKIPQLTATSERGTPAGDAVDNVRRQTGINLFLNESSQFQLRPNPLSQSLPPEVSLGVGEGYAYKTKFYIAPATKFMNPQSAMRLIQDNPNLIFPFHIENKGGKGPVVLREGARLDLINPRIFPVPSLSPKLSLDEHSPVVVERVAATQFTFRTLPGHFDQANALISFRTFQDGNSIFLEHTAWAPSAGGNAAVAPWAAKRLMWPIQAERLREALLKTDPIYAFTGRGSAQ